MPHTPAAAADIVRQRCLPTYHNSRLSGVSCSSSAEVEVIICKQTSVPSRIKIVVSADAYIQSAATPIDTAEIHHRGRRGSRKPTLRRSILTATHQASEL